MLNFSAKDRQGWLWFGVGVGVLVLAFAFPLVALLRLALSSDLHSHTLLIPLVAGYLVWIERERLPAVGPSVIWVVGLFGGAALICLGVSYWSGILAAEDVRHSLRIFAFVLALVACGGMFLGGAIMRQQAFPFAFFGFFIPLPSVVIDLCETFLQHASADVSYWAIELTGTPVFREGLVFHLPGRNIRVAQECSGFRSTFVLFIVSLVASRMFLQRPWCRALLVLAILPLGVVRNGFRIWTLATLVVHVNPDILDSWLHHHGGPIFFALSLIPLYGLLWWLFKYERKNSKPSFDSPRSIGGSAGELKVE